MKSIVSEKGQITIPKEVREAYGIYPGVEVQISYERGAIVIIKVLPKDPLDYWRGRGKGKVQQSSDQYLERIRKTETDEQ